MTHNLLECIRQIGVYIRQMRSHFPTNEEPFSDRGVKNLSKIDFRDLQIQNAEKKKIIWRPVILCSGYFFRP